MIRKISNKMRMGKFIAGWVILILILIWPKNILAAEQGLVISELLPDPKGKDTEAEFIEIYNPSAQSVDLTGWQIKDLQKSFSLPAEILGPDQYRVIYYSESKLNLNNEGDEISLVSPTGQIASLVIYTKAREGEAWGLVEGEVEGQYEYQWLAQPTAGQANLTGQASFQPKADWLIEISEIFPNPDFKLPEFIELYNPYDFEIDLSAYQLDDEEGGSGSFALKNKTIPARGYLAVFQKESGIWLNNDGDEVRLLDLSGKLIDKIGYQKAPRGLAWAKINSSWHWTEIFTPGENNRQTVYPDDLVIQRVLPNPLGKDKEGEIIELYNLGDEAINLANWQLDDEKDAGSRSYTFERLILGPHEHLVLTYQQTKITLNNDEDWVYLIDPAGREVSSLHYSADQKQKIEDCWYEFRPAGFGWACPVSQIVVSQENQTPALPATYEVSQYTFARGQQEETTMVTITTQFSGPLIGRVAEYLIQEIVASQSVKAAVLRAPSGESEVKERPVFKNPAIFAIIRYTILILFLAGIKNLWTYLIKLKNYSPKSKDPG